MGIFSLIFGNGTETADEFAWQQYQNGYASDYTKETIARLNCSNEMKGKIEADIRNHTAGAELPAASSGWVYCGDGWYFCKDTNTYSNIGDGNSGGIISDCFDY